MFSDAAIIAAIIKAGKRKGATGDATAVIVENGKKR
jgi:hypothetical protein